MKRFLIKIDTAWCGIYETYAAIAESEEKLPELADELGLNLFEDYGCMDLIIDDLYEQYDEVTDKMIDSIDEFEYIYIDIEEFIGNDEEWEMYELVYNEEDGEV